MENLNNEQPVATIKTVGLTKIILGLILAVISFVVFLNIVSFIVMFISGYIGFGLSALGIHIYETANGIERVVGIEKIIDYIVSAILAYKVYRWTTRKKLQ